MSARDPLAFSLVEDRAHAGETSGADAVVHAVAEDISPDDDDDCDGDDAGEGD